MYRYILIILVFGSLNLFSQKSKLIHLQSEKTPIGFAHISIEGKLLLVSNSNGNFVLNADKYDKTEITISHVGYKNKTLSVIGIQDTIYLEPAEIQLDEITISSINVKNILAATFKNFKYKIKVNYHSSRLIAVEDSLVFYTEENFKFFEFKDNKLKKLPYSKISYNVSKNINFYNVKFPFISTLTRNPYHKYQDKIALNELIKNAFIDKVYRNTYRIKSVTDTTSILLYINKKNNRLVRFEKEYRIRNQDSPELRNGGTKLAYSFDATKKTVTLNSFKFEHVAYIKKGQKLLEIKIKAYDIKINKIKTNEKHTFESLRELKAYKQKEKIIDAGLYSYFNDSEASFSFQRKNPFLFRHYVLNMPLNLESRFNNNPCYKNEKSNNNMAIIYNNRKQTFSYNSNSQLSTNINPINDNQVLIWQPKKERFNPYGVNDPKKSIFMGTSMWILKKIF